MRPRRALCTVEELSGHDGTTAIAEEEIANSLSHGLGFVAAVAAAPILVLTTAQTGRTLNVIGAAIFAVTMVLLYCASTIYHAVPHPRAKALLKKLDHGAIFLLIAGTYTPFTLGALSGPWGGRCSAWSGASPSSASRSRPSTASSIRSRRSDFIC